MILQFPGPAVRTAQPDLTEVRDILLMMSLSLALIASPKTTVERARDGARKAQKVAEAYADIVSAMIEQRSA